MYSCNKDDISVAPDPIDMFNEEVKAMSKPNQPTETLNPELISEETVSEDGRSCIYQIHKWNPGYSEAILLNPSTDAIWPGSLLAGRSLTDGSYTVIATDRKPLTLSTSLENIKTVAVKVANPKLSTVRTAIQELLSQEVTGDVSANITYEETKIHSSEHLKLAIGGNYDGLFADVNAQFDFNDQSKKSRYIVKFMQVYYSIDVDHPETPADWFETIPTNLGDVSPVYVSSVKYGRIALLTFESTEEATKLKAAIEASFNGLVSSGSLEFEAEHEQTMNNTTIKALVVGGGATSGANLIQSTNNFNDWVEDGGTYNKNSVGAPLAYTLRFLNDNSVAKLILAGEYQVRECDVLPITEEITLTHNQLLGTSNFDVICPQHTGGDREFDGNGPLETAKVRIYTQNSDKELWVEIDFHVVETQSDWTEGSTRLKQKIFEAQPGFHISNILSGTYSEVVNKEDDDHSINKYYQATSELVDYFEIMGDTSGDDVPGTNETPTTQQCQDWYAYLKVVFNPIRMTVEAD